MPLNYSPQLSRPRSSPAETGIADQGKLWQRRSYTNAQSHQGTAGEILDWELWVRIQAELHGLWGPAPAGYARPRLRRRLIQSHNKSAGPRACALLRAASCARPATVSNSRFLADAQNRARWAGSSCASGRARNQLLSIPGVRQDRQFPARI